MLKRGVTLLIILILNLLIVYSCPTNCYDFDEDKCDPNCDDFTGATGPEILDFENNYGLTNSQLNSLTPYQLSEFYNNLGMVTKYPDNFKAYCKTNEL